MPRPAFRIALLGVAAFAIALLVVLPARWLAWALPAAVHCGSLQGSLWNGRCQQLELRTARGQPVQLPEVSWQMHPGALLLATLSADLRVVTPALQARGLARLRAGGSLRISALSVSGNVDHASLAAMPSGWSGRLEASDVLLELRGNRLQALGGTAQLQQLRDTHGVYGDFTLTMPPQQAAPFKGQLRDRGGVLALDARLGVNADRSWQIDGTIQPRAGAPAGLDQVLDQLGTADVSGRRTFSVAGTAD